MSYCSVTFCSACLIHQCNIITHLNPNATLTFLYNDSNNLVDFSGVGHTHRSHVRTKKYGHQVVAATAVCPNDMVTVWEKKGIPTALIDIPNRKKVTISINYVIYTVEACITVPESCKGGKTMRTFLHCNYIKAKIPRLRKW